MVNSPLITDVLVPLIESVEVIKVQHLRNKIPQQREDHVRRIEAIHEPQKSRKEARVNPASPLETRLHSLVSSLKTVFQCL